MIRGTLVFVFLAGASFILFGFNFVALGFVPVVLFVAGLFLNAAVVGLLVCILVVVFGNRAEVAAWSVVSLMLLIYGIYYPVSILPGLVQVIARSIPLTYLLEYFRQFYGFPPGASHVLVKGYGMVAAYLSLEIVVMKAALARAKRTGILLKLSE